MASRSKQKHRSRWARLDGEDGDAARAATVITLMTFGLERFGPEADASMVLGMIAWLRNTTPLDIARRPDLIERVGELVRGANGESPRAEEVVSAIMSLCSWSFERTLRAIEATARLSGAAKAKPPTEP